MQSIEEIKQAIDDGRRVYWHHTGYEVIKDSIGQYLIAWHRGERDANYAGLGKDYEAPGFIEYFFEEGDTPPK